MVETETEKEIVGTDLVLLIACVAPLFEWHNVRHQEVLPRAVRAAAPTLDAGRHGWRLSVCRSDLSEPCLSACRRSSGLREGRVFQGFGKGRGNKAAGGQKAVMARMVG